MAIPTLDLSRFTCGPEWDRQQLAADLLDSFAKHGFVKLVNHGISNREVSDLFDMVSFNQA